jgi:multidrug efflux pump subunit AcrA (membrane-fusion protein)
MKKQNSKNALIVIVSVILAIMIIAWFIRVVNSSAETMIITDGTISQSETLTGYYVREEKVVNSDKNKNGMQQIVTEGQKVAANESIFRYYSESENDNKAKINEIDEKIQKLVETSDIGLYNSDLRLIDSQMLDSLKNISTYNSIQNIKELKSTIKILENKKAEIVASSTSNDSEISKLISERKTLEKQRDADSTYIKAPVSGILSYRIDGLEEQLKFSDINNYNNEYLENLNLDTGKIIPTSTTEGKIVNNFECYVITNASSEEAKKAKVRDKVQITLPTGRTIDARVANIIEEQNGSRTIAIKFSDNIDEVTSYRKVSFDVIWWNSTGYKVKNSGIIEENNLHYVIRSRQGHLKKVLVKIKKQTDTYSIVKNYSASELKELNYDKKALTSLMLNDEILLNPTEDEIKNAVQ